MWRIKYHHVGSAWKLCAPKKKGNQNLQGNKLDLIVSFLMALKERRLFPVAAGSVADGFSSVTSLGAREYFSWWDFKAAALLKNTSSQNECCVVHIKLFNDCEGTDESWLWFVGPKVGTVITSPWFGKHQSEGEINPKWVFCDPTCPDHLIAHFNCPSVLQRSGLQLTWTNGSVKLIKQLKWTWTPTSSSLHSQFLALTSLSLAWEKKNADGVLALSVLEADVFRSSTYGFT